jgi:hypothetical protein
MSRDNAPRRWWSGQWFMVLLGSIAAVILFRYGSDRGWWFNNLGNSLGFLSGNNQGYQTVNTGASVGIAGTTDSGIKQETLNPIKPSPATPMPPDNRDRAGSYNNGSNGRRAMW